MLNRKRIPDINYSHMFGCLVFIHNYKDHLGKFDAKANDGYFLGYSSVSKAFRVFNTRRQQIEGTYHVTFDENIEAIKFTNTSVDEIGIDDSSRYPPDEFLHEDDPSRQYQVDSDISYSVIPHGRSLTELTQENHIPENDTKQPQPTGIPSGNNTEVSGSTPKSLVPDVTQSHILNQASTSSHPISQDRWSRDQHIELVNIIGNPGEGMLTRSMVAKLTTASASKCLFADFLSEIEPKKVSEALKHPGWIDDMQEELNQFYRNKVWTLVPLPYGKIIGSKWEEGIDYDETFAPVQQTHIGIHLKIFLAFATYMNFKVYQIDVKSAFLNGKLKEEVYVKQPPGFESSEFPDYVYVYDIIFGSTSYKLCKQFEKQMTKKFEMSMMGELTYILGLQIKQDDKGISICQEQYTRNLLKKYEIFDSSSLKTPMVPPNNLGPDLAGKPMNKTSYRGMIGSLMYLTATRPDIQFSIVLCARYQSNLKESHLTTVKRILRYLKEKAPQVPAKYLVENWFVGVLRNSSQWLFLNGQRPLTLDFNTFCSSTGLDYNNGRYVAHPTPEVVKKKLGKIAINPSYLDKTLILKNSFLLAWRILFTFVIQVLGGNYSSTEQVNLIQQLLAYCLITGTEVDIGEIDYIDLVTKILNKSRLKYVSYPRFISCALQVLLGYDYTRDVKFGSLPSILSNSTFTKELSKVPNIELMAHMIVVNNETDSVCPLPFAAKKKKVKLPSTLDEGTRKSQPLPEGTTTGPKDSGGNDQPADKGLPSTASNEGTDKTTPRPEGPHGDKDSGGHKTPVDMEPIHPTIIDPLGTDVRAFRLSNDEAQESEEAILGAGDEVDEDSQPAAVQHQSSPPQADKPQSSTTSYTEASNSDSSSDDLLKKYDNILPLTKRQLEKYLRKVSSILFNRTNKLVEASMSSLDKSSTAISDLYKGLNIITKLLKEINNVVKDDPVVNKKISEAIETFTMISTNITKRDNETNTATEDPRSHTGGETDVNKQEKSEEPKHATDANFEFISSSTTQPSATQAQPITIINPEPIIPQREGKGIPTDEQAGDQRKLVKASSIVHPDPDAPFLVPYTINGKLFHLTAKQIEVHLDKEEQIKKAKEESRLLVINKPEVIKVVREKAKKLGIHPKEAITAKAGEKFKKAQDAKHEVLKKKPTEKVRKSLELKKHKYDNYMWTISSRLKLEKITEIKMHPKTKPVVITVYRGTDGRNFDVHNPFAFGEFGISELDELREIIHRKKNTVVKDLMNSLSRRYKRIKKIPDELGIPSALPAPIPE
ncbi:retrovirus-related pol polyprotein from transposon TNT 1-94 [Tanacetum coccineum]